MLKLGVIGCGRRIYSVINAHMRELDAETRVVGIVDPDENAVRKLLNPLDTEVVAFFATVAEMVAVARPDALLIGTHCREHADYACEVAQYGLPVFLEKPVAINMSQALKLEDIFAKTKCPNIVSFPLRVSPLCELTNRFIQNGAIGRPEHITALNYVGYGTVYFEDFYRDFGNTQGMFLQKATHDLDYMAMLMDSPIVRVAAMKTTGHVFGGSKAAGLRCSQCDDVETCMESPIQRQRNESSYTNEDHFCVYSVDCGTPETGMNEDASSVLLEFASGAHGIYTQVFFVRRDAARRGAIIAGYNGTLDFDWVRNDLNLFRHHEPFKDHISGSNNSPHFGGDRELARDFLKLIQKKKQPRATLKEGLNSVYVCLAAKESAETGKFIDVRQIS